MLRRSILLLSFLISCITLTKGQVVINELMVFNDSLHADEDGAYDSWVELFNAGQSNVDLDHYALSDNKNLYAKWQFPKYPMAPGDRLMVYLSGKNKKPNGTWWRTAVHANQTWKYALPSSNPGQNWINLNFNDGGWKSGKGGIGYGDGDDSTVVNSTIVLLMRQKFIIQDTSTILQAIFSMDYDDGFVAYLNGTEIARSNVSGTPPTWNSGASADHEALMYQGYNPETWSLDKTTLNSILVNDTNILAIMVQNTSANSSDLSAIPYLSFLVNDPSVKWGNPGLSWISSGNAGNFHTNFSLDRKETLYLFDPKGKEVDAKLGGELGGKESWARIPDGTGWCLSNAPTPDVTNDSMHCYLGYAPAPDFSLAPGFYKSNQSLTLSTSLASGIIHYTTTGVEPQDTDYRYTNSTISLTGARVIRARTFDSLGLYLPSKTVTNTYLVNEKIKLPVICLTTAPRNLFDYNDGIYTLGPGCDSSQGWYPGANFWKDWEKPVHVEYFKPGGGQLFEMDAGLSMHGNYSRTFGMKSFRVECKSRYDSSYINYPIFPNKNIRDAKNFNIRNGGVDQWYTYYRDDLAHVNVRKLATMDYEDSQPCVVFINGNYWGVYEIREKQDQDYLANNHGVDPNNVDIMNFEWNVQNGDWYDWYNMAVFITSNDMSVKSNYDSAMQWWDIENYVDYIATETYINNQDWIQSYTNNIRFWKEKKQGAKWRYALWDCDAILGFWGDYTSDKLSVFRYPGTGSTHSAIFNSLVNSPYFLNYFVDRYCDLMNTIYTPDYFNNTQKQFVDTMENEMTRMFNKWYPAATLNSWKANNNTVTDFINKRAPYARSHIQNNFGLNGQVELELAVYPKGAGKIKISTIIPGTYPWKGIYFDGVPVRVTAIPNPGYAFSYWTASSAFSGNDSNQSIELNYTSDNTLTAYFTGSAKKAKITVSEINYHSHNNLNGGNWVELHNYGDCDVDLSGYQLRSSLFYNTYSFPTNTVIGKGDYLVIAEDTVLFHTLYPTVNNVLGNLSFGLDNATDSIVMTDAAGKSVFKMGYADNNPYPLAANGWARTMEHVSDTAGLNDAASWFNGCIGGSPGTAYTPCSEPVIVSEINYKSAGFANAGDWLELWNKSNQPIDLSGFTLSDGDTMHHLVLASGTTIQANGRLVIANDLTKFASVYPTVTPYGQAFDFGLGSNGGIILFDTTQKPWFTVVYSSQSPWWPSQPNGNGYTLELKSGATDYSSPASWFAGCLFGSPGDSFITCTTPINLTEVMYKPRSGSAWFEIRNNGDYPLFLDQYTFKTKSKTYTLPGLSIKAKSYFVFGSDSSMAGVGDYYRLDSLTLTNGDTLQLRDQNGQTIWNVYYGSATGYPVFANGQGCSMELIKAKNDPTLASSWQNSCPGGSPGKGAGNCDFPLLVNEINHQSHPDFNPGDWIELKNNSSDTIHLSGWSIHHKKITYPLGSQAGDLAPGHLVVLASDVTKFNNVIAGFTPIQKSYNLDFGAPDTLEIIDPSGKLSLIMFYDASSPWANGSAGQGYTLERIKKNPNTIAELCDPATYGNVCFGGSPGAEPGPCAASFSISEINYHDVDAGRAWLELHHTGTRPIWLNGVVIGHQGQFDTLRNNSLIKPGAYVLLGPDTAWLSSIGASTVDQTSALDGGGSYWIMENGITTDSVIASNAKGWPILADGWGYTLERNPSGFPGTDSKSWDVGCPGGSPGTAQKPCSLPWDISELSLKPHTNWNTGTWMELQNLTNTSLSTQGLTLVHHGLRTALTARTVGAGEYTILASDTNAWKSFYPGIPALSTEGFNFNQNDGMVLLGSNQRPILGAVWGFDSSWPDSNAQFAGVTWERQMNTSGSTPTSWFNGCFSGSPATGYLPCSDSLMLSEINFHSDAHMNLGDWVEVHNLGTRPIFTEGFHLNIDDSSNWIGLPQHVVLPGQFIVLAEDSQLISPYAPASQIWELNGLTLSNGQGAVGLHNASNLRVWRAPYQSVGRSDGDGTTLEWTGNHFEEGCLGGSPGAPRSTCSLPDLPISEINYNSNSSLLSGDWIEFKNNTLQTLDAGQYSFSINGQFITLPTQTMLAGDRLILAADPTSFSSVYPGVSGVFATTGLNLSGTEKLKIYQEGQVPKLQYVVKTDVNAPWPSLPNGKGNTLEWIEDSTQYNLASSWIAGCFGGSPGKAFTLPCTITGIGAPPSSSSSLGIFPNPTRSWVTVASTQPMAWSLFSATGQCVAKGGSGLQSNFQIDLSSLAPGIYLIQLTDKDGSIVTGRIERIGE